MDLIEARRDLEKLGRSAFHIKEAAAALGMKSAYASQILKRLQNKKMALSLKRGVWALSPEIDPYLVAEALIYPHQSYISFHTALKHHGLIEQIPEVIYVATLGRSSQIKTPIGTFSFHHLEPKHFKDFERVGLSRVPMASAEKALFDFLYFSYGKTKWFKKLPEIELPKKFDLKKVRNWINSIRHEPRRQHVEKLLNQLCLKA